MQESIAYYQQQGYPDGQIATLLKNKGFNEDVVDQALSKKREKFGGTAIRMKTKGVDVNTVVLVFIILAVCAAVLIILGGTIFGGMISNGPFNQLSRFVGNFGMAPKP